ncbi:MAG: hydroxymethylbilane synthase [Deltaproteobacteria bacterium]|nr:hydroxymethylbilane synthase [Deltaproteobacteria bacterium]
MTKKLIIGARGSPLSLAQTQTVVAALKSSRPELAIEVRPIRVSGDDLASPAQDLGLKGLFVKEIEKALLAKEIDVAVHSAKDLPQDLPEGLILGPVPPRASVMDALVSLKGFSLTNLPKGAKIGTSSQRRAFLLNLQRPDLTIVPIRGNLQTRLNKLQDGSLTGLVLAAAGLERLNLLDYPQVVLPLERFTPAPGQGALALEIRAQDAWVKKTLAPLNDEPSALSLAVERGAAKALGAGCQVPAGASAQPEEAGFRLWLMMTDPQKQKGYFSQSLLEGLDTVPKAQAAGWEAAQQFRRQNGLGGQ